MTYSLYFFTYHITYVVQVDECKMLKHKASPQYIPPSGQEAICRSDDAAEIINHENRDWQITGGADYCNKKGPSYFWHITPEPNRAVDAIWQQVIFILMKMQHYDKRISMRILIHAYYCQFELIIICVRIKQQFLALFRDLIKK